MDEFIFNDAKTDGDHNTWIDVLTADKGTVGSAAHGRGNNVFGFEDLPNNAVSEDDDLPVVIVWDIDGIA